MKRIAITVGDPSGVGPEVIRGWAFANRQKLSQAVFVGHENFLRTLPAGAETVRVGPPEYEAVLGKPDPDGARVAFAALEEAAAGCLRGDYGAVATGPISKECMRRVGFNFQGQTEFFADRWRGVPVMSFAGEKFIVSLVTWHCPLKEVSSLISYEKIERAVDASAKLARRLRGISEPRIAVCGLNPHAGEGGIIGREEVDFINPALSKIRIRHPNLSQCLPPDTVFERVLKGEFDCIVSMYHDQALAPLKAIEFDKAVNVSMNLPFLRVSPDHGTAFSIAGKNLASFESFACAFDLAEKFISCDSIK